MNRSDIIKAVANQCTVSQKDVDTVIDLFVETIKLSLQCDEDVLISGFGKFVIRDRKSVQKTNPKTGERIVIPAKRTFVFSLSKSFRSKVTKVMEARLEEGESQAEKE